MVLPFSDAGQEAVWNGEGWVETAVVEDERLLIHSEPVVIEGRVTASVFTVILPQAVIQREDLQAT